MTNYHITVDYSVDLANIIAEGKYDWVNDNIKSIHFPQKHIGKRNVTLGLLHLGEVVSSVYAIKQLTSFGYRPGQVEELITVTKVFPKLHKRFPLVALGTQTLILAHCMVPCVYYNGSQKCLDLGRWNCTWNARYQFLGVKV
jgi:hypothetical protein